MHGPRAFGGLARAELRDDSDLDVLEARYPLDW